MNRKQKDDYGDYDIDDWQWEFLRRNPRYQRTYKAVEWLRNKLDRRFPSIKQQGWFNALGCSFAFTREYGADHDWVWRYDERCMGDNGSIELGWYLDLPAPNATPQEYKAKVLRTRSPRAVAKLGEYSDEDDVHVDIRPPFAEQKLTVLIDVRYDNDRIFSELRKILRPHRSSLRNQLKLYKSYLDVWDLWQKGLSGEEIARQLWPEKYESVGGRDFRTGEKTALSQQVYDHRDAAMNLIESAFPAKKRTPKIQK